MTSEESVEQFVSIVKKALDEATNKIIEDFRKKRDEKYIKDIEKHVRAGVLRG